MYLLEPFDLVLQNRNFRQESGFLRRELGRDGGVASALFDFFPDGHFG